MKIARWPTSQTASQSRKRRRKENGYAPNARKRGVEVNDVSGRHCDAYILLFNFSRQGVMRHEKSLGRYCRWISRREHAPGAPRPTAGSRWRAPPASASPRLAAPRAAPSYWRATAARGDIIIRYERVYEAANHSHVHISNGRSPRYSV